MTGFYGHGNNFIFFLIEKPLVSFCRIIYIYFFYVTSLNLFQQPTELLEFSCSNFPIQNPIKGIVPQNRPY